MAVAVAVGSMMMYFPLGSYIFIRPKMQNPTLEGAGFCELYRNTISV